MIIQIIGWYCIIQATLKQIVLIASVIQKDDVDKGVRFKVRCLSLAEVIVAVWCFK